MLWERQLGRPGVGGIAATDQFVILGDRDPDDFQDVWHCLDATSGAVRWQLKYLALGKLDWGNSPRATPLVHGEHVILAGAMGEVRCVKLATGEVVWQKNLRSDFGGPADLPWGFCASPLLVDGKLILLAGAAEQSLIALDPKDGRLLWQTPGDRPAYGSLMAATFGGRFQIVGYDAVSLRGWDASTGEILWSLKPPHAGDFHVPTPIEYKGQLIVMSEGNGTHLYGFDAQGRILPQSLASNHRLAPDMSSAVCVNDRLICVHNLLTVLNPADGLRLETRMRDPAFGDYAALIADESRVLVFGKGEMVLLSVGKAERGKAKIDVVARCPIFADNATIYAHPAIVDDRLYVRGENAIKCIRLPALR